MQAYFSGAKPISPERQTRRLQDLGANFLKVDIKPALNGQGAIESWSMMKFCQSFFNNTDDAFSIVLIGDKISLLSYRRRT